MSSTFTSHPTVSMMCMIKKGVIGGTVFTVDFLLKLTTITYWHLVVAFLFFETVFETFQVLNDEPHGRPADIYNLGSFFIEMTVGVPTLETLQEKVSLALQRNQFASQNSDGDETMASKTTWVILVVNKGGALSYNFTNEVL